MIKLYEIGTTDFSKSGIKTIKPISLKEIKQTSLNGWEIQATMPFDEDKANFENYLNGKGEHTFDEVVETSTENSDFDLEQELTLKCYFKIQLGGLI